MWVSVFFAKRYFRSKKKKNFIHFISRVAMFGVAVGTAALIIVLSVFNGLEGVLLDLYRGFDPDLKVMPISGKSFVPNERLLSHLRQDSAIAAFSEVIEENALVQYRDKRQVLKIKGLEPTFLLDSPLKESLKSGSLELLSEDGKPQAVVGRGVQFLLGLSMDDPFNPIRVFFPRNLRPGVLNPADAYSTMLSFPSGVFSIEREFDDNYLLLPLTHVARLTRYNERRSAIEIRLKNPSAAGKVQRQLIELFGDELQVLDNRQQHASLLKALEVEKLFVFITFSFILLIASFNIFFSLSLLAIEKKKDIAMLQAMGAKPVLVRNIFLIQGSFIAFSGAFIGLVLGVGICLLQQEFGLVSMGAESSILQAYPIKLRLADLLAVVVALVGITFLISFRPAYLAARTPLITKL
jgi:lipoprotein-releasing system permease protein